MEEWRVLLSPGQNGRSTCSRRCGPCRGSLSRSCCEHTQARARRNQTADCVGVEGDGRGGGACSAMRAAQREQHWSARAQGKSGRSVARDVVSDGKVDRRRADCDKAMLGLGNGDAHRAHVGGKRAETAQ
eukprot:2611739-Rhodomonas_salina.1